MPDLRNIAVLYALFGNKGPRALGSSNHSFVSSQFYGASWELGSEDFSLHKYVWCKSEFSSICKAVGFQVILLTNATRSHCPGRDFAIICKKPGIVSDPFHSSVKKFVESYGNRRISNLKSFYEFSKILSKLLFFNLKN
jgi:hypothetical protein